jgi:hypothetical protein
MRLISANIGESVCGLGLVALALLIVTASFYVITVKLASPYFTTRESAAEDNSFPAPEI